MTPEQIYRVLDAAMRHLALRYEVLRLGESYRAPAGPHYSLLSRQLMEAADAVSVMSVDDAPAPSRALDLDTEVARHRRVLLAGMGVDLSQEGQEARRAVSPITEAWMETVRGGVLYTAPVTTSRLAVYDSVQQLARAEGQEQASPTDEEWHEIWGRGTQPEAPAPEEPAQPNKGRWDF